MGMLIGLIGLIGALVLGVVGGIVGWKKAISRKWKIVMAILGFFLGAIGGFIAGFGLGFLFFASVMG